MAILARAFLVVNIHLMRARRHGQCVPQQAISVGQLFPGLSMRRSRHWNCRHAISISTMFNHWHAWGHSGLPIGAARVALRKPGSSVERAGRVGR